MTRLSSEVREKLEPKVQAVTDMTADVVLRRNIVTAVVDLTKSTNQWSANDVVRLCEFFHKFITKGVTD